MPSVIWARGLPVCMGTSAGARHSCRFGGETPSGGGRFRSGGTRYGRQDLLGERAFGNRADVLVGDGAPGIDDEGFGYAIDAPVDGDAAIVGADRVVGVAERVEEGRGIFGRIL